MPLVWTQRRNEKVSRTLPWSTVKILHRGPPLKDPIEIRRPYKREFIEDKSRRGGGEKGTSMKRSCQSSSESDRDQYQEGKDFSKKKKNHNLTKGKKTEEEGKKKKDKKKKEPELNDKPILGPPPILRIREKWSK
jgi:hypothetical protein